jgi:hypothetical protein
MKEFARKLLKLDCMHLFLSFSTPSTVLIEITLAENVGRINRNYCSSGPVGGTRSFSKFLCSKMYGQDLKL